MSHLSHVVRRVRATGVGRNTGWVLASNLLRLAVQALYFLVIARSLGAAALGVFVGVSALATTLAPFASMGMGVLLVRDVSRDRSRFPPAWGNALFVTAVLGTAIVALIVVTANWVLPPQAAYLFIAAVALAEVVGASVHGITTQVFLATDDGRRTAQTILMLPVLRTIAACALALSPIPFSATNWGVAYLAATLATMLIGIVVVWRAVGGAELQPRRLPGDVRLGLLYAVGHASQVVHNDIDKTIVARLDTVAAAGAYGAAYRVMNIAFTPITALIYASFSRFFQHGATGIRDCYRFARDLLPLAMAYGLVAAGGLFLAAPLMTVIFGGDYAPAGDVLRILAVLPLIKGAQYLAADTLTGSDHQRARSAIQIVVAITSTLAALWVVPRYSIEGAAWLSVAADATLLAALWGAVAWHLRTVRLAAATEQQR